MTKQKKLFIAANTALFALVIANAVCFLVFEYALGGASVNLLEGIACGTFVLAGLLNLIFALITKAKGRPPYKYFMFAGLVFAAVAELVIELNQITGIIFLVCGHLLLHYAFTELNPFGWKDLFLSVVIGVFALCFLLLLPAYDFGAYKLPVVLYGLLLASLLGNALDILLERRIDLSVRLSVSAGALLLLLSDLFLSLNLFAGGGKTFDILRNETYYLAEFLFALSIGLVSLSGNRRERVQMNVFSRLYCRAVQFCFRAALPLLPYRKPTVLNSCAEIAPVLKENENRKALIVTGKTVCAHGLTKPVEETLTAAGIAYAVFDGTCVNPTVQSAEEARDTYIREGCDCVIAVGGGSPIDCAKALCARLACPKKSLVRLRGVLKAHGKTPLFLAVPTTAGSGSEATIAAVITDENTHDKFTVISFCLAPMYAVLDPVMTKTLPPIATAETGMDAFTHAVEAYIGRATTRETRRLCEHAVALIKENLLKTYADGDNEDARRNMQLAAFEAGYAFSQAYVGYVHALSHALGGAYNYPHGRTNATLLPIVLRAYGETCERRLALLAKKSGVSDPAESENAAAQKLIELIETLNKQTGIPETLEIEDGDIPALAKHAAKEANPLYPVPRLLGKKALGQILRTASASHSTSD